MGLSATDYEPAFEAAWNDPRHTRIELPAIDVNAVLEQRYHIPTGFHLTRAQVWDMEVRKAWQPDRYIPYVVRQTSAASWDHDEAADTFVRKSEQRLWLSPDQYGLIIEQTYRNHDDQRVTFIGAATHPDADGTMLHATTRQPLFHVQHFVGGEEDRPLNLWRAVHLTEQPDPRLLEVFARIGSNPWLPEFFEIYIQEDLGAELSRLDEA